MSNDNNRSVKPDDAVLWDLFRGGDESAYTKLMKAYSKTLFNYGFRICQDKDFLKDCIQDVFLELWNRRLKISSTPAVKYYLFKALRLRIFREQAKWNRGEPLDDNYGFVVEFNIETKMITDLETLELSARIQHVLNALPNRQREIIYLRFYEGLDFDNISQIMEISKQSVHNLLQKAYKSFRSEWLILIALFLRDVI
ncbi:RNA polymerase sigma factor (sigma-70 family) [Mucilaginibacter oryzae]|uniref:RNA polymerase sigma factor (Sigma-70 family) n=1 Tax=Mucilaginibacter oryzae TaxID=468058 RepID=A0A316H4K4_9SPHI|nr:sigma-70 family RNA polymerase sigma factor [Mucilaginibacter oryzae]PWK75377.1 RNA polymerase sigma factor (sigma-70 family) [Mucilaginibacter oryzae]